MGGRGFGGRGRLRQSARLALRPSLGIPTSYCASSPGFSGPGTVPGQPGGSIPPSRPFTIAKPGGERERAESVFDPVRQCGPVIRSSSFPKRFPPFDSGRKSLVCGTCAVRALNSSQRRDCAKLRIVAGHRTSGLAMIEPDGACPALSPLNAPFHSAGTALFELNGTIHW